MDAATPNVLNAREAAALLASGPFAAALARGDALVVATDDTARAVFATQAGLAMFGASNLVALNAIVADAQSPGARRFRQLARSLPPGAAPRLEQLRFFAGRMPVTLGLSCARIVAPNGARFLVAAAPAAAGEAAAPAARASVAASSEGDAAFVAPPLDGPVRFLWSLDSMGCFGLADPALAARVGPNAPQLGESPAELRARVGFDAEDALGQAVAARRTFSALRLEWPEPGGARARVVSMAGAPQFDRERNFFGLRGFGVFTGEGVAIARAAPSRGPLPALPPEAPQVTGDDIAHPFAASVPESVAAPAAAERAPQPELPATRNNETLLPSAGWVAESVPEPKIAAPSAEPPPQAELPDATSAEIASPLVASVRESIAETTLAASRGESAPQPEWTAIASIETGPTEGGEAPASLDESIAGGLVAPTTATAGIGSTPHAKLLESADIETAQPLFASVGERAAAQVTSAPSADAPQRPEWSEPASIEAAPPEGTTPALPSVTAVPEGLITPTTSADSAPQLELRETTSNETPLSKQDEMPAPLADSLLAGVAAWTMDAPNGESSPQSELSETNRNELAPQKQAENAPPSLVGSVRQKLAAAKTATTTAESPVQSERLASTPIETVQQLALPERASVLIARPLVPRLRESVAVQTASPAPPLELSETAGIERAPPAFALVSESIAEPAMSAPTAEPASKSEFPEPTGIETASPLAASVPAGAAEPSIASLTAEEAPASGFASALESIAAPAAEPAPQPGFTETANAETAPPIAFAAILESVAEPTMAARTAELAPLPELFETASAETAPPEEAGTALPSWPVAVPESVGETATAESGVEPAVRLDGPETASLETAPPDSAETSWPLAGLIPDNVAESTIAHRDEPSLIVAQSADQASVAPPSAPTDSRERGAEIVVLRPPSSFAPGGANIIPIRPGAAGAQQAFDGASDIVELSAQERDAFREIARALGVRMRPTHGGEDGAEAIEAKAESELNDDATDGISSATATLSASSGWLPSTPRHDGPTHRDVSALIDALPIGALVLRDGEPVHLNRTLLDLVGFENLEEFRAADGLEQIFKGRDPVALAPQGGGGGMPMVAAGGELITVDAQARPIWWGGAPATLIAVSRSRDAERQSQLRALESEAQRAAARARDFAAALDVAADGLIRLDASGRILAMNAKAEALFGYDQKEAAGEHFLMLLAPSSHAEATARFEAVVRAAAVADRAESLEVVARDGDGRSIPVRLAFGRLTAAAEREFCAVVRDLSQAQAERRERDAARAKAEKSSAQKTEFLARVSHEIRTPLHAILGFAEVIMEERFGPIGNDRYKDYVKDIHASGQHVMSLANDLLDLTKIEAGKMELAFSPVDANRIIRECVALMQPQAARERIIMRLSLFDKLPNVMADERSLRQIMLNLMSNAVKFNEPGGQVIVSTALDEAGHAVIRVRDTGVGMNESELSVALEPFRQIPGGRRDDGTGLGLPLTKALAEANHADFSIKSKKEQGTLVEVAFPSVRAAQ